jgi:NADH-quinone oxidoreductase subunit N
MDKIDFLCLTPLIILSAAPIIIMLGTVVKRNFALAYAFTLLSFLAAFISLFIIHPYAPDNLDPLLIIDNFGILFLGILFVSVILITVLSFEYLRIQYGEREEFFILLLVSVLGASILVLAQHFITFFLGLEILSISLYVLTAYLKWRDYSIEAGIKYLVVSSLSTAFLLFGMALVYSAAGTMSFSDIMQFGKNLVSPVMITGFGMMLVAVGFKLALVPFHMWAADVYQGASIPVTLFIATISKGAVFALALRLFLQTGSFNNEIIIIIISAISIFSMFTGNFLALTQTSLKRLLAYSSIAQLGYISITLITGPSGAGAAIFYLMVYVITTIAAFGALSALSVCEKDADQIDDIKGLYSRNPWLTIVFSLSLMSLAGLPLTAGFMSKFYLVLAGGSSGLWLLAASLVINSAISLYYYLKVIRSMFLTTESERRLRVTTGINFVLFVAASGILVLGVLPSLLIELIGSMI